MTYSCIELRYVLLTRGRGPATLCRRSVPCDALWSTELRQSSENL